MALITALLIVAIVATIAAYLSLGQQVWLRQVQNLNDRSQAESMRLATLDYIGFLLAKDAADNETDNLTEIWAVGLPPFPYEGGTITVRIEDAEGRFNLNNLVKNQKASPPDFTAFRNLLRTLDLDQTLADAVLDWIDPDSEVFNSGAEDVAYLASTRPYRAANVLLTSIDELRLVKGFDGETVEKLRPFVVALPTSTLTNINTAPEEVLAAMFSNVPSATVQQLIRERETNPFKDVADVQKFLPQGVQFPNQLLNFATSHFIVYVDVGYGRLVRKTVALVRRDAKTHGILWHHPVYPKLPSNGEDSQSKN